jgi:DnaK suppressor protein
MSLSNHELDSLRKILESKRAELSHAHDENVAIATHAEEENYPDPMDAATRAELEAERLELAHRERTLLGEVDRAITKIAAGTYGVSELSGRPIPVERLRAVPWARLTADEEERNARR